MWFTVPRIIPGPSWGLVWSFSPFSPLTGREGGTENNSIVTENTVHAMHKRTYLLNSPQRHTSNCTSATCTSPRILSQRSIVELKA